MRINDYDLPILDFLEGVCKIFSDTISAELAAASSLALLAAAILSSFSLFLCVSRFFLAATALSLSSEELLLPVPTAAAAAAPRFYIHNKNTH